jgi:hypothetical protein
VRGDGPIRRELRRLAWSILFFVLAGAAYAALWAIGLFH